VRLGAPVFDAEPGDPSSWALAHVRAGYRAAFCPVDHTAPADLVRDYERAARDNDIVIAETGAWSNPLSPDPAQRARALELCRLQLDLADRIGARCCVNISGSHSERADGPHPKNLTRETFDQIVDVVRGVIDDVKPVRTFFTLETMPWAFPNSADSYVELLRAIDRPQFAVHFDPVNLINSPDRYFANGELIRDFVDKLGPHIRVVHAKDTKLQDELTVHLDEVCPGDGALDYPALLAHIDEDVPLMIEHLRTADAYARAAAYIRSLTLSWPPIGGILEINPRVSRADSAWAPPTARRHRASP
jgi:sugar phosphate isomerase/epimerase